MYEEIVEDLQNYVCELRKLDKDKCVLCQLTRKSAGIAKIGGKLILVDKNIIELLQCSMSSVNLMILVYVVSGHEALICLDRHAIALLARTWSRLRGVYKLKFKGDFRLRNCVLWATHVTPTIH
jgi:hypothetical protein